MKRNLFPLLFNISIAMESNNQLDNNNEVIEYQESPFKKKSQFDPIIHIEKITKLDQNTHSIENKIMELCCAQYNQELYENKETKIIILALKKPLIDGRIPALFTVETISSNGKVTVPVKDKILIT